MPSTVFAVPIQPGKTEAWKSATAEMKGPRRNEYLEARRKLGITKEVVCRGGAEGYPRLGYIAAGAPDQRGIHGRGLRRDLILGHHRAGWLEMCRLFAKITWAPPPKK